MMSGALFWEWTKSPSWCEQDDDNPDNWGSYSYFVYESIKSATTHEDKMNILRRSAPHMRSKDYALKIVRDMPEAESKIEAVRLLSDALCTYEAIFDVLSNMPQPSDVCKAAEILGKHLPPEQFEGLVYLTDSDPERQQMLVHGLRTYITTEYVARRILRSMRDTPFLELVIADLMHLFTDGTATADANKGK